MKPEIVIVGGGISGLATAYFLGRHGLRSTIIEKQPRLGGLIQTDKIEGCELEAGPDSFVAAKPAVLELAATLDDLSSRIIGSNDRQRRIFMVRKGRLVALPSGMVMMAPSEWGPLLRSSLFSWSSKLQFVRELSFRPRKRTGDVSVSEFVQDHFGPNVANDVAGPLLSGVFGGDSTRLSARSVLPRFLEYEQQFGSLIKGVRSDRHKRNSGGSLFLSFEGGMQTLTDRLAAATGSHTRVIHAEAQELQKNAKGWQVTVGSELIHASHLVLACPAFVSGSLLAAISPALSAELGAIPYSSAVLVTVVFRKGDLMVPLDGFGFLVPQSERQTVAAATWINTKFPSRIRDGLVAIRTFMVDPEAGNLIHKDNSTLLRLVLADCQRLMGITASPAFHTAHRWPNSMPQYLVGHAERRTRIQRLLAAHPDLSLVTNALEGVGVPDCVRLAKAAAEAIAAGA